MNRRMVVCTALVVAGFAVWSIVAAAGQGQNGSRVPSIEGAWQLAARDMPDGSTLKPPAVVGLLTFNDGYRNFNVMWKDKDGAKAFSISIISIYKLTASEYSETNVYYMMNDEIGGTGVHYDVTSKSASSPVAVNEGQFSWKMPLFDEPAITYDGDHLVANGHGFVDHWQRVK